ncbi:hypothetical protein ACPPVV_08045 [Rhodanobacter sp. Col0626]|uniref:hypothetical protein n=1 Tax=Rhodanobacter sp. Col0626 TaxID=3415679 RepID=UPI003CEDB09B
MSFFSHLPGHNPLLRLLSIDHTGRASSHDDGDGLRFGYPMNLGDTLNTIASKLQIPINELLTSNPSLHADSPLTPGLDIALPTHHIDRVIDNVTQLARPDAAASHATSDVPRPPPSSNSPALPMTPASPPDSSHDVVVSPARTIDDTGMAGRSSTFGTAAAASSVVASSASLAPTQGIVGDRSAYAAPGSTVTGKVAPSTDAVNFSQAASSTIQMVQSQHDGELPPPPLPQNADRALPLFNTSAVQTSWMPQAVPTGWNTVIAATGSNDARLQIMALLAIQIGGAAISNGQVTGQTPGFIDPQAVAAYANSMRAGHSIDLGAGRRMEFSLASDQLRRVGAIGEEGRAVSVGSRRTGDGLDEVQDDQRAEADEETQDGHEQRQHEQRRLAAIAALRRRRRPLSTRCRYWHGERRPLYASSDSRYPKGVDLAEFRSRLPQRYLWTASPGPARPGKPRNDP